MKLTPREILLARHAADQPRLDAIRKKLVSGLADRSAGRASVEPSETQAGWERLRQWLWPAPAAWGALGAAWVFILALNSTAPAEPAGPRLAAPSPQTRQLLLEQRQLMVEAAEPPEPPQPRRQTRAPWPVAA